ncbi:MAG TPA: MaoC family dehydratase, partial [Nocardioidaceae bacterium]|nr:MaoC family dehydratase [Nocardioidaceae bacterium]
EAEGESLGTTSWMEVTQEKVDLFADATGDHQWIHVDPAKAAEGPFGGTIAHGLFTLSLLPVLLHELYAVEGISMAVNYGLNKVRFPAPVPVGARVRATSRIDAVEKLEGAAQGTLSTTIEVEGSERPACIVQSIVRYYA